MGVIMMTMMTKMMTMMMIYLIYPFQDGTPFGGASLSMLSAQCGKLSSKAQAVITDPTFAKTFHPWKKGLDAAQSQNMATINGLVHNDPALTFPRTTMSSCAMACANTFLHPGNGQAVMSMSNSCAKNQNVDVNMWTNNGFNGAMNTVYSRWPTAALFENMPIRSTGTVCHRNYYITSFPANLSMSTILISPKYHRHNSFLFTFNQFFILLSLSIIILFTSSIHLSEEYICVIIKQYIFKFVGYSS